MNKFRETFLLHRIRSRQDREAYAELYDAYVQKIYRFVHLKVKRTVDAEELTADVFTRAWTYLCGNTVRHFNAYLFTVARRVVADYYRSRARQQEITFNIEEHDASDDVSQDALIDLRADVAEVLRALEMIHDDYRELIALRYLEQMEIKEIAESLGKTPNNVRVTLHRAVGALRTALKQEKNHGS